MGSSALSQQFKTSLVINLTHDFLQRVHLTLDLTFAPFAVQPNLHGHFVLLKADYKMTNLRWQILSL